MPHHLLLLVVPGTLLVCNATSKLPVNPAIEENLSIQGKKKFIAISITLHVLYGTVESKLPLQLHLSSWICTLN